jgi:hypothetical protein
LTPGWRPPRHRGPRPTVIGAPVPPVIGAPVIQARKAAWKVDATTPRDPRRFSFFVGPILGVLAFWHRTQKSNARKHAVDMRDCANEQMGSRSIDERVSTIGTGTAGDRTTNVPIRSASDIARSTRDARGPRAARISDQIRPVTPGSRYLTRDA